jgi:hypothetical protein
METSPPNKNVYDERFFTYSSRLSPESAKTVVPVLRELFPQVKSVVDFGCARGVWLDSWKQTGVEDIQGVDGDYVDTSAMIIPNNKFHAQDLNDEIYLGRRFDLACSLEVAEHLQPENSDKFVQSLTRHANVVLFSAAPPGQGGESHINEQSLDFWRDKFRKQGYSAYDCVRDRIAGMDNVLYWYRFNIILYVRDGFESKLSKTIQETRVKEGVQIKDISPLLFKLRKLVIRHLPNNVQNMLARVKAKTAIFR